MISINFITGAGLKKCIPITRSGLLVTEAIRVMEMDEVLLARMASFGVTSSSFLKMFHFTSIFSTAASMTRSQFPKSSSFIVAESLLRIASFSGAVIFSFWMRLSKSVTIFNLPFSMASVLTSLNRT
jgi:hypothetical protein